MTQRTIACALGVLALAGVASCALVALGRSDWGNDYVGIWGLKAQAIERSGRLDAVFAVDRPGDFSHPEYPLLWPVVLAVLRGLAGDGRDLVAPLLFPILCGIASLLAFRATRAGLAARALAAATVALLPFYRVAHLSGYAEGLLVVWLLAAVGEIDALERSAWSRVRLAAFLSAAAATKQEGLLAAAAAIGVLLVAGRLRAGVTAAAGVGLLSVAPWQVLRALHPSPHRDFALGALDPGNLAVALGVVFTEGVLPNAALFLCAAGVLAAAPAVVRRRAGVLLAVGLFVAAILAGFLFTLHPPRYHVAYSFARWGFVATACLVPLVAEAVDEASRSRPAAARTGVG